MNNLQIESADWHTWSDRLTALRNEVFVIEQKVPADLEIDGLDSECQHVVALVDGMVVGTGRLLPNGFIGRMCVKGEQRGLGIGGKMLAHLIEVAKTLNYPRVSLNAQSQVIDFYHHHGFEIDSEPFMEAGILHQRMKLEIK